MERHCTAHLRRGVTLRKGILNCLKGKGCSGSLSSPWQIKLCCEYHPCQPSPSSQGSSSIDVRSQTESSHIFPKKKEPRQIFTANGGICYFPHQLSKFLTEPLLYFYFFFNHRLAQSSLKHGEIWYFLHQLSKFPTEPLLYFYFFLITVWLRALSRFNVFYFPQDCLLSV